MRSPRQAKNDSDAAKSDTASTGAPQQRLVDNRTEAVAQRERAEMMNSSPRVKQQRALSDAIHNSPRMVAQRHETNVRVDGEITPPAQASHLQRDEDANAHPYAQGNEIHLGAGQERHLPHEAWHVVQQAQGRVRPTLQLKTGAVNDDPSLEQEADVMGERAVHVEQAGFDALANNSAMPRSTTAPSQRQLYHATHGDGVVQRVVYPNDVAMWAAVAPTFPYAGIMAVVNANGALNALYQDVIGHLGIMNFVQQANQQPEAAMVPNPILYDIYFDTPNQQAGRFQQEAFFVGAMIHEMAHVASNQLYATNVAPDQPGFEPMHIANMHLPAPVGPLLAGTTVGDNQVYGPGGLDAQVAVMDANWTALEAILLASHDFSTEERALLQRRLDYARVAAPEAHYDTVLADVLFYLRHQHMHETQFYAQATAMLQEANLRRVAGAGTVPHLPVVAVPVPNINTLHQRIGLLINDPLWAEQGEAFIGHKTPDGIRQLRALLQNGGNWRALLIALRDHAAVVALRHSPRRSAVTQQAYNALSMDYRTQGLAPVIAAVNAVIVLL